MSFRRLGTNQIMSVDEVGDGPEVVNKHEAGERQARIGQGGWSRIEYSL